MDTFQGSENFSYKTSKKIPLARKGVSYDGKPLDFSFKQIKNLEELRSIEPRSGERKQPPQEIEEPTKEEQKQLQDINDEDNKQQNENENQSQNDQENENKENNNDISQQNQNYQQSKGKDKAQEKKIENKQPQIIRVIPTNTATGTIQQGGTLNTQVGTRGYQNTMQDTLGSTQKNSHKVTLVCASLILSYNSIKSLENFKVCADYVMMGDWKKNLQWIDLSHNYLENLDYDFRDVPNLKSLYLHCNYLSELKDLQLLSELPIRSLTIHGNPIETIPQFRLYIIAMLQNLKRLDSVLVSKKERDNSYVLQNIFRKTSLPKVKNPRKPPEENVAAPQKQ